MHTERGSVEISTYLCSTNLRIPAAPARPPAAPVGHQRKGWMVISLLCFDEKREVLFDAQNLLTDATPPMRNK